MSIVLPSLIGANKPASGSGLNAFSLSFDGTDDYMTVPHNSSLSLSSAGTFSVWVKMNTTHTTDYPYIFAKWGGSVNYTFFTKVTGESAGKFKMRYYDGADAQSSATEINRGEWVHLAATLDGSNLIYYVNGNPDNTVSMGMGTTNTGDLYVGVAPTAGFIREWPGLMDEAAIFSTKLTATQISNIYNSGVPGDIGPNGLNLNPVAWWRMGDGGTWDGTNWTIPDASTNSNTGTTVNMAEASRATDVPS